MNYSFDKKTGSFIMKDYETGKSWDNHIWNKSQFITTVDQFGCSTSKLVTEHGENVILTHPGNDVAVYKRYDSASCYIRDDETKDFWNPGYGPSFNAVEDYTCEHGLQFTKVSSRRNGVYASHEIGVFQNFNAEAWKITVKNETDETKKLSVFACSKFNLNGFVQPRYYYAGNTGSTFFLDDISAIFCREINPFMTKDMFSGYITAFEKTDLFCARYDHFIGTAGNATKPVLLEKGLDLPCTHAAVRDRGGILQNKITLAPGEEKVLYYAIGFTSSNPQDLIETRRGLEKEIEQIFETKYERGLEQFGALRTNTPIDRINNIMNFWATKQVSYCMIGKKAVRDNAQIAMGMLNYDVPLAKKNLAECTANQFSDGHALLTWSPFSREKDIYSDPSAWLILAICEYIKESGDTAFLNEHIPFLEGEDATVYEHLKRAAVWFMREDNYGPNNLPRIHHADWNDALNIPDDTAESVFIGMMICLAFKELADLSDFIREDKAYGESLRAFCEDLAGRINKTAYNGEYYVRAFSKFGVVGDKDNPNGGNIYVNPQVWSILSGIVPQDRLPSILKAVDTIETKDGVPLCSPAYQKYDSSVGRMSAMPPGVYENGGIYNHACAFKVMADCKAGGRGEQAVGTLLKMIPDGSNNPSSVTTTEPYVFTNCYVKHETEDLVVGFSWQTGSSAWGLRDFYEGILGIERTYEGLKISPNFPADWKDASVTRPYRNSVLNISYKNEGKGCVEILVDGSKIDGNIIPAFNDALAHEIEVKF